MIDLIHMGTTVATNALLDWKEERMSFVITKGYILGISQSHIKSCIERGEVERG